MAIKTEGTRFVTKHRGCFFAWVDIGGSRLCVGTHGTREGLDALLKRSHAWQRAADCEAPADAHADKEGN